MLERIFDSKTHFILNESMDATALRNNVIANNIANVDTPKFKRSEVIFEENLKKGKNIILDIDPQGARQLKSKLNMVSNLNLKLNGIKFLMLEVISI